ncbi:MAG: DUF1801 domain-containing protein [Halobacteriales archaeon]|nr:DUF1801 domain-containing protein [Halobacteriales archaeon]
MAPYASHDEYVAAQPKEVQAILAKVRKAIRKALPGAEEAIAWNMPTYKVAGKHVISFCAFKAHWSLFGSTRELKTPFSRELAKRNVGKGTIQFPYDEPVPEKLVEDIARFRATLT